MGDGERLPVVLVVSDDPHIRDDVEFGFSPAVDVRLAGDAREAWGSMSVDVPAVVVVDIQTGSAGGYGLLRDMELNERLIDVPVMLLLERAQDGWLARQVGADVYRVKPIEVTELVESALKLAHLTD